MWLDGQRRRGEKKETDQENDQPLKEHKLFVCIKLNRLR